MFWDWTQQHICVYQYQMKKIVNRQVSMKAVSAKKRRFNTIQTDQDWDQKQQRRSSAFHRFHTQMDHISSTDQSMYGSILPSQAHSTKNRTKKSFKWQQHVLSQSKKTEHSTTIKKNKNGGVCPRAKSSNTNITKEKSVSRERKTSCKKERSGSRPRKSVCRSPKFKTSLSNKKKSTTPAIIFRDFETFQPKQVFIEGFTPITKLSDEAGCSVWSAKQNKDKLTYLVKQVSSPRQIELFSLFQLPGGKFKREFLRTPNVRTLPRLLHHTWDQSSQTGSIYNIWLVFDCLDSEQPLVSSLYSLHYEDNNLLKIAEQVHYKAMHRELTRTPALVKALLLECSRALSLLTDKGVVHGRVRPSNIYVGHREKGKLGTVRLHGFENWFYFKDFQKSLPMLASEYSPPEILNYVLFDGGMEFDRKMIEYLEDYQFGWVIDVWSLGMVLLELFLGYPLALRPDKVCLDGQTLYPIFKPHDSIGQLIEKQLEIVYNLDQILSQKSQPPITRDLQLQYLLKRMLSIDPKKRISPAQIIHLLK